MLKQSNAYASFVTNDWKMAGSACSDLQKDMPQAMDSKAEPRIWQHSQRLVACHHSARRIGHIHGLNRCINLGLNAASSHSQGIQPNHTCGSSSWHGSAFCRFELCSSTRSGCHSMGISRRRRQSVAK